MDFSKNEVWGELGHRLRSFHPKLFTLTDMSAHPMGWGAGERLRSVKR